jgi:aminocarboxymuconate-semialdehyde decarboxylase
VRVAVRGPFLVSISVREAVTRLDVPLMVHGYNQSVGWGDKHAEDRFETTSIVGDCVDETLFFWYLIRGGALDVFPTLKTYIRHSGGAWRCSSSRAPGRSEKVDGAGCPQQASADDYLPNFCFDLDAHHPALRRAVVEVVGADQILYGTNFGGVRQQRPDRRTGSLGRRSGQDPQREPGRHRLRPIAAESG